VAKAQGAETVGKCIEVIHAQRMAIIETKLK